MKKTPDNVLCTNEGCGRPAAAGEIYCGECDLERMLYRRDLRGDGRNEPGRGPDEFQAGNRPERPF